MVRYLLRHPISVMMAFLALVIIGAYMYASLPVTLMPAIDIPNITVKTSMPAVSADEMEAKVVIPLRRNLLQTNGLKEITSRTSDGNSTISLDFHFGVDTDLAFIEVNEKIDAAMSSLPRELARPKAIKTNTTDIPILYLHAILKDDSNDDEDRFIELGNLAENVISKRIEQLPEIAMVDITGLPRSAIMVEVEKSRCDRLGITVEDIEAAISSANLRDVTLKVKDKQYVYDLRIDNGLSSNEDIASIMIDRGGRLYPLGELCSIRKAEQALEGCAMYGGRRAVTLAVIGKTEDKMGQMQKSLDEIISEFSSKYPEIEFHQSQNQSEFLSMTIDSLIQNLILGLILVFTLTLLFIGNARVSFIIGLTVVLSLVISMTLFYMFGISINIISLSGMILAVGMMIDNSTIVSENILQIKESGKSWTNACDIGTTEMITPLLSSMLTTIAVFLPLVFISGIAGALFADEAFSISAGLAASYVTSIVLLPVIIYIAHDKMRGKYTNISGIQAISGRLNESLCRIYERAMGSLMKRKSIVMIIFGLSLLLSWAAFKLLNTEMLPAITHVDAIISIDWAQNLNADENTKLISDICKAIEKDGMAVQTTANVGHQDFMLNLCPDMSQSQSIIYVKSASKDDLARTKEFIKGYVANLKHDATVLFTDPDNVFSKVFDTSQPLMEVRLSKLGQSQFEYDEAINQAIDNIARFTGEELAHIVPDSVLAIKVDREKLYFYGINYQEVVNSLQSALCHREIGQIQTATEETPIHISLDSNEFTKAIDEIMVRGIPVKNFIRLESRPTLKERISSSQNQYVPVEVAGLSNPKKFHNDISSYIRENNDGWNIDCAGAYYESNEMMRQMILILSISILLMYFILSSQFENFLQPLIVLVEIPVDTFFALIVLWFFGFTMNLMTAIGIIVTCGIIVNDSILKIDAINEYRRRGVPVDDAIHRAGIRRLRPILLTSLTTIFAMVPSLFGDDMASELQKPMAVAMIASMTIGTLVSIFMIPILYKLIYRTEK